MKNNFFENNVLEAAERVEPNATLRAIDLYSGVGGWSLGLSLAGIDVVASYEWWDPANRTNATNNDHNTITANIREIAKQDIPFSNIDIVVGSPPCTQFSFANRGGNGDLEDGFKDMAAFFEIVSKCRPKWWAMENVPRLAALLPEAILPGRPLHKYREIIEQATIEVINCSDYGVPQARKRCIAGNFDFSLLHLYKSTVRKPTLGDIINALDQDEIFDPVYGFSLPRGCVSDHTKETILSPEEERINREAKTYHPVYNTMSFPEKLNQPARTVTATCTRVSRESLIVEDRALGGYRRLTVRERACLQSFPINYQFMGGSVSDKFKMIGNAIPPLLTYYIAQAIQRRTNPPAENLRQAATLVNKQGSLAPLTKPENRGGKYRDERAFRLALPNLRFKSGMRFELTNFFENKVPAWHIDFYYGNSKAVRHVKPDAATIACLKGALPEHIVHLFERLEEIGENIGCKICPKELQNVWTNRATGQHPFYIVDELGAAALAAISRIKPELNSEDCIELSTALAKVIIEDKKTSAKVHANNLEIAVGLILAGGFNQVQQKN